MLKSRLNGKNKVYGINTWAVSLLRYCVVIIKWLPSELKELERLTLHRPLHLKSDINKVYGFMCQERKAVWGS